MHKEQALSAIYMAIFHLGKGSMKESARVCLQDAVTLLAEGNTAYAHKRAVDSLRCSVGVLHMDYERISKGE